MKPNDKAYREFMRVYNKTHVSLEAQVMASLTAAYAAQFQGTDYADLVARLRKTSGMYQGHAEIATWNINPDGPEAADALETVLADRDGLKELLPNQNHESRAPIPTDWWSVAVLERRKRLAAEKERDALAARLAPVDDKALVERDALKKAVEAEQSMTKLRLGPFLKKVRQEKQMTLREVEEATGKEISNAYLSQLENGKIATPSPHALYTLSLVFGVAYETLMECAGYIMPAPSCLAPVDDKALVEMAAVAIRRNKFERTGRLGCFDPSNLTPEELGEGRAAIAAIRPHIEAAERERCAKVAEGSFLFDIETWLNSTKKEMTAHVSYAIATAIRSGK